MGLRETLEAATCGPWTLEDGAPWRIVEARGHFGTPAGVPDPNPRRAEADAALAALAPELAAEVLELRERHREAMALVLDMGETLADIRQNGRPDFGDCGAATCEHPGCLYTRKYDALLARLDQLGKEQR